MNIYPNGITVDNAFIKQWTEMVTLLAWRMSKSVPPEVSVEELISAGFEGLMDAAKKWCPEKAQASTYFPRRIRGSMLDYLRSINWAPRMLQTKLKKAGEVSKKQFAFSACVVDIQDADQRDDHFSNFGNLVSQFQDLRSPNPEDQILREEFWDEMTSGFSARDRKIFFLYFRDGLTFKEIGKSLSSQDRKRGPKSNDTNTLSESRVSQVMKELIARLRVRLGSTATSSVGRNFKRIAVA